MNSTYKLILKPPASKFIKKQEKKVQLRILDSLEKLKKVPPDGDIKKLRGEQETFRLIVGTFRFLFSIDHVRKQIVVETVGNRGDIYK